VLFSNTAAGLVAGAAALLFAVLWFVVPLVARMTADH
jgi:hypothetical protein